jgi:hypothetical protein
VPQVHGVRRGESREGQPHRVVGYCPTGESAQAAHQPSRERLEHALTRRDTVGVHDTIVSVHSTPSDSAFGINHTASGTIFAVAHPAALYSLFPTSTRCDTLAVFKPQTAPASAAPICACALRGTTLATRLGSNCYGRRPLCTPAFSTPEPLCYLHVIYAHASTRQLEPSPPTTASHRLHACTSVASCWSRPHSARPYMQRLNIQCGPVSMRKGDLVCSICVDYIYRAPMHAMSPCCYRLWPPRFHFPAVLARPPDPCALLGG